MSLPARRADPSRPVRNGVTIRDLLYALDLAEPFAKTLEGRMSKALAIIDWAERESSAGNPDRLKFDSEAVMRDRP